MLATILLASYHGADMQPLSIESRLSPCSPKTFPQLVSHSFCCHCDVCCRFPEADSFLRPYFTAPEIAAAAARGLRLESFPDPSGSQIDLVRNSAGEGYLCPAFDPSSSRCGIYEVRPLDCQLYPLALMWDVTQEEVLLGWDAKCPFMHDTSSSVISAHAERVADLLSAEETINAIADNPRLVGRFQEDVVVIKPLPQLTARLLHPRVPSQLSRLMLTDKPRFDQALERAHVLGPHALAAYAFPYHFIWTMQLSYWWMESQSTLFLFAYSPDGWFMPLPPLGPRSLEQTAGEAFELMRQWNGPSPVSRIENVMASHKAVLERIGLRCRSKEGDYLYPAEALAGLVGDRYKSQRALCNRAEREQVITVEPYQEHYRDGCLALQDRWARQKESGSLNEMASMLLQDAQQAHAMVFAEHERIGLSGVVAIVRGSIAAYTFGYWLTPQTWCVLLEVADRSIPGLAQWLFRETCRTAVTRGAVFINAMDDAGLSGLRSAKLAYHPSMVIENYVIIEGGL